MHWETWTVRTTLWRVACSWHLQDFSDFSDFSDLNQLLSGLPLADQRTLSMCATYHKRPATRGHVMCHVKLHGGPWRLSCFKLEEIWFTVHGLNPRIWTNTLKCFKTLSQDIQVSPQISLSVHQFISFVVLLWSSRPFSAFQLLGLREASHCSWRQAARRLGRSSGPSPWNFKLSEITHNTKGQKDFVVEFNWFDYIFFECGKVSITVSDTSFSQRNSFKSYNQSIFSTCVVRGTRLHETCQSASYDWHNFQSCATDCP